MKIAYIVFAGTANYTPANGFDEILDLLPYLQNKGLDIQAEIWDDPNVDWIRYEVALLKTPWDYHLKFAQFNLWLKKIEDLNIKLLNDYRIVRWNMDKHYLDDIIKSGFEVIASVFIDRGWTGDPDLLFEQVGSNKLIIKPCISGWIQRYHGVFQDDGRYCQGKCFESGIPGRFYRSTVHGTNSSGRVVIHFFKWGVQSHHY